jgi:hypothetical protein
MSETGMIRRVFWVLPLLFICYPQFVGAAENKADYSAGISFTNQQERYIWFDYSYENEAGRYNDWYIGQNAVLDPASPANQLQFSYRSTLSGNDGRRGYEYSFWSQPGEFYIHSLSGIFETTKADSAFIFQPRISWVRIHTTFPTSSYANILSPGFDVSFEKYLDDNWTSSWTFGLNLFTNSSKLSGGSKPSLSISRRTLDLATSLDRLYLYYDLSYSEEQRLSGVTLSYSQSAFDSSQTTYLLLYSDYSLTKQLDLELSVGSDFNTITAEIGVSYYW